MKFLTRPLIHKRQKFGASAFGRWVLILLLAVDLTGSPFHAHSHDLGPEGLGSHALHASDSPPTTEPFHIEADAALQFTHSIAALLPVEPQVGPWQPGAHVVVSAPPPSGVVFLALNRPAWRAALERIPTPPYPHVRPDGRAPPLLHA